VNKSQSLKLARRAFDALDHIPERSKAYAAALAGEKQYRRGSFLRHHPSAASAPRCAELFVARWLAEYALNPDKLPSIAGVLCLRPDAVLCAAIVAKYTPEVIRHAFAEQGLDLVAIAALNYILVVSPEKG
jgi:hypothetical protein